MAQTTLFVCALCRFSAAERKRNGISGGQHLINQLRNVLQQHHLETKVTLEPLRCMAGCSQPCNASLVAPGKLTFILSNLSPTTSADDVTDFCQQYTDSVDGRVPYQARSQTIREATAFVLPPLPTEAAV